MAGPTGSAAAQTRQQLDELDALLQKMLALPVHPAEDAPAPPKVPRPAAVRLPAAAAPDPRLTGASFVTTSASASAPAAVDKSSWSIDLNPRQGSSVLGPRGAAANPGATPPLPELPAEPIALKITVEPPPPTEMAVTPSVAVGPMLRSAAVSRRWLGRWWASPARQDLLGYCGLAMFAISLVWGAIEWCRWTR